MGRGRARDVINKHRTTHKEEGRFRRELPGEGDQDVGSAGTSATARVRLRWALMCFKRACGASGGGEVGVVCWQRRER